MQVLRQHLSMKTVTLREAPLSLGTGLPTFLSQNVEEVHIVDLPPDLPSADKGRKKMAGFDVDLDFMCACMQRDVSSIEGIESYRWFHWSFRRIVNTMFCYRE